MALATARRRWLETGMGLLIAGLAAGSTQAQQMPIGSVSTLEATVTGVSSVAGDRAQLGINSTVVAKDHVAYVQLSRGGSVKVCATSGLHLTAGAPAAAGEQTAEPGSRTVEPVPPVAATPLMVALDRGAMELRMATVAGDMVMTPDLRFNFSGDGQIDIHLRVTRNGDTCVENRMAGLSGHPELHVGSLFGNETYNVLPGQHVLFEGGNLREVVDNESSPCGCPETPVKPLTGEAVGPATTDAPKAPGQAIVQHPFPADVSQGLAPPPPVPQAPQGVTHTQIATTLVYNPTTGDPTPAGGAAKNEAALKSASPAEKKGFFHSVGRFFKRIF